MLTALSHVVSTAYDQKTITAVKATLVKRLDADRQTDGWGWPDHGANARATTRVAPGLYRAGDVIHKDQAVKGQAWLADQQQADGSCERLGSFVEGLGDRAGGSGVAGFAVVGHYWC